MAKIKDSIRQYTQGRSPVLDKGYAPGSEPYNQRMTPGREPMWDDMQSIPSKEAMTVNPSSKDMKNAWEQRPMHMSEEKTDRNMPMIDDNFQDRGDRGTIGPDIQEHRL